MPLRPLHKRVNIVIFWRPGDAKEALEEALKLTDFVLKAIDEFYGL
jgi:hypothetical protein